MVSKLLKFHVICAILISFATVSEARLCVLIHNPSQEPIWSKQHTTGSAQTTEPSAWYVNNISSLEKTVKLWITKDNKTRSQTITLGPSNWKKFGNTQKVRVPDGMLASLASKGCSEFKEESHWTWVDNTTMGIAIFGGIVLKETFFPGATSQSGVPCSDFTGAAKQNCIGGWQGRR